MFLLDTLYIFQGIHVPLRMNYNKLINLLTLPQFKFDKIWILRKVIAQHNLLNITANFKFYERRKQQFVFSKICFFKSYYLFNH